MRRTTISILAGLGLLGAAGSAAALEVDPNVVPEINLGGRLITTLNGVDKDREVGGNDSDAEIDFSDSSLLVGFSKYLFGATDFGYAAFGLILPEDDSDLEDDIFVHQALVGLGGAEYDVHVGRTRLPNTLISFPTLRDDDLLAFTHVGNASANVEAEEDQIFGGVLSGMHRLDKEWRASLAATARAESDLANLASTSRTSRSDLNGAAAMVAYEVPEAIKFDRGLRFAGFGLDWQRADRVGGGDEEDVTALLAGFTYNLSDDPEASWALDAQGIYNFGDSVPSLATHVARARSEQYAIVGAVRYADRPQLQTRWQAALTLAFKDYQDFSDASSFAVVPSFAWRLGSGIELLSQYRFLDNGAPLATAENLDSSHTLFLGLSFAFDATFNESVGERDSILYLEHDMLNPGPAGFGH